MAESDPLSDALGRHQPLEEAASFFLWDAFEHANLAAQLEVAGLIFGETIMSIDPEPDWVVPPLPDNLADFVRYDVEVLSEATTAQLATAWDEAQVAAAPSSGRRLSRTHPVGGVEMAGHVINLGACVEAILNRHLLLCKESAQLPGECYLSLDQAGVLPKILFAFKEDIPAGKLPIGRLKYLTKLRNHAVHPKASSAHSVAPTVEDLLDTWADVGRLLDMVGGEPSRSLLDELARGVSEKWFE